MLFQERTIMPTFKANEVVKVALRARAHDAWRNRTIGSDAMVSQDESMTVRAGHGRFQFRHCLRTAWRPVQRWRIRCYDIVGHDRNAPPSGLLLRRGGASNRWEKASDGVSERLNCLPDKFQESHRYVKSVLGFQNISP